MKRLTVFTPTYNRAGLLKRAYESLVRQTSCDFVWLIVDDGSTDNTREVVSSWQREGLIDIEYAYFENGGKMRAHNRGVELAKTELFVCLDSDDYLTDSAVEELISKWDDSVRTFENGVSTDAYGKPLEDRKLGGIVAHKGKSEGELLGESDFPVKGVACFTGLYDIYLKGFTGETTLMFRTDVLRGFPFPEIDGEKYVPEDYIYDKIDEICVLAVLDRIITVCEIVSEGYTDSVMRLKRDNAKAWYLYYEQRARITPFSVRKFKYLGFYVLYAKRTGTAYNKSPIKGMNLFMGKILALWLTVMGKE